MTVQEFAYAKLNLHLDVGAIRNDGFHTIKSVMHSVSLADTVEISGGQSDIEKISLVCVSDEELTEEDNNLVYRAAKKYLEYTGISAELSLKLTKNIPLAAGLGGGSSDAAATLRALNRMFENRLSSEELIKIAAELGSDVPFCLFCGMAICEGRGERINKISAAPKYNLVIAKGTESISTAYAYEALDKKFNGFMDEMPHGERIFDELLSSFEDNKIPHALYNIFEAVIEPMAESVSAIKKTMLELGAVTTLMSGSGPSVFGIFESQEQSEAAQKILSSKGYLAFNATSVYF